MRSSGRARLGVGILLLWAGSLGWHVKRQYFRPLDEVIASGARTLPPGTSYYAVFRQSRQVGWAQSRVDTLPASSGFLLRESLEARLPELGAAGETRLTTEAELGPSLALRRFVTHAGGALGDISVEGEVIGDSVLRASVSRGASEDSLRLRLDGPVILSTAVAMRLAAERSLRAGDRFRLPVLDPVSLETRPAELRVLEAAVRTYVDSATTDEAGRWIPARRDTVKAWLVEQTVAGIPLRSWIDEDGRILEGAVAGLRVRRTAFELAYLTYRALNDPVSADTVGSPATENSNGAGR